MPNARRYAYKAIRIRGTPTRRHLRDIKETLFSSQDRTKTYAQSCGARLLWIRRLIFSEDYSYENGDVSISRFHWCARDFLERFHRGATQALLGPTSYNYLLQEVLMRNRDNSAFSYDSYGDVDRLFGIDLIRIDKPQRRFELWFDERTMEDRIRREREVMVAVRLLELPALLPKPIEPEPTVEIITSRQRKIYVELPE